jgi:tetratricopeptide (TPR) repeat protein
VAHYALADIYRLDPRQADYHRRRVWELRPDTAEACFVTSLGAQDEEAIDWLTQALAHDPEHFESRIRRAQLLLGMDRPEEAECDEDEAIRLRPGNDQGWWFKADALLRQRRYAAAIPLFSEAIKLQPRYPSLYGRATACRRLGRFRQALDDYGRIVKLSPEAEWNARWIFYHRATVHWILGDPESALADYERFAQYHPDPFWSDARRYLVLRELQRPQEARQHLELAASKPTDDAWLRAVFEYLLAQREAESLLSLADTDGRKCEANYYIAENCFQNGDLQTARQFYDACVATGVDCYVRSFEVTPSSEYELASWRLETLGARRSDPNTHP